MVGDFTFLLFEVPIVEHLGARQDAFGLEQLQQPLAQQQRCQPRPGLVQHRLLAQDLDGGCDAQLVEEEAIETGARYHVLFSEDDDVHLEEERKEIEQEGIEVREQLAATLFERLHGRRVELQLAEGAAVVRVGFDPVVLEAPDASGRLRRRGYGDTLGRHRRDQRASSIRCWIVSISSFTAWTVSTGRPPVRACSRMVVTLARMWRILVCASTTARLRKSLLSHWRCA